MEAIGIKQPVALQAALIAPDRSPEIPESADIYGWLIGSWSLEVCRFAAADLTRSGMKGEVHFGRVLEGRAVQDVWIMPARASGMAQMDRTNNMYGTTFRVWDPSIQAWNITWTNPVSGHREEQIGRLKGSDIVQIGTRANGTTTRWRFTEITPDSFHWIGEALQPDGATWKLEGEFRATRLRPDPAKSFSAALLAPGRAREIPQAADAYGWLIGSWELDVFRYHPNGTITTGVGEAHFGWVLEGRAVQDVWIMPNRSAKTVDVDRTFRRYGTTVHIWNPLIQAWDVTWIDPVTNIRDRMTARSNGADVVQVGTHSDRTPIRWSFTEITPDAFRWLGEALDIDGETWKLEAEFRARRMRS